MIYDLARAIHFIGKLKLLVDNCPREQQHTCEDNIRISFPLEQTKDAIEQLQIHLDEIAKHIEKEKSEQDYWANAAMSGDPERFVWEHSQNKKDT